ncbi:hypothetical protein EBZ38_06385 [bacterium]|nr:hypothetical protein [bacterium]
MIELAIINMIANSVIFISMTLFFILIYGNDSNAVHRWPALHHWTLKISLVIIIAAALWNAASSVYTVSYTRHTEVIKFLQIPPGETLMNIGLALLFSWGAWFHWRLLKRKKGRND